MRITGKGVWGEPRDAEAARQLLRHAVELGINFIDTADAYGPEVSERLIAEALHPYPKGLVIATKGGLTRQGPDEWLPVGRPEYIRQCVEMSLRRLKLDRIDLYQLHRIDPKVPAEETLGALKDLQAAGKIRHVGLSEVKPKEIEKAAKVLPIVSVQNEYNLGNRKSEASLQYCEKHNLAFIPWFPMAAGDLAKPGGPLDEAAKRHDASVSPTRPGLAPAPLAGHAAHPRHFLPASLGGEYRGGGAAPERRRMGRNRGSGQERQILRMRPGRGLPPSRPARAFQKTVCIAG